MSKNVYKNLFGGCLESSGAREALNPSFHCFCTLGTGTYGPRCREPAPNVPLTFSFVLHANQEINNS